MTRNGELHSFDPATVGAFRLEGWLVLPSLNRLKRGDETIQLEPRIMQVLALLASRPGELLTREFLFEAVWPDSVVCEDALTRTISELRRVFGDEPASPRVIETIRKSGYRLLAPVEPVRQPDPASPHSREDSLATAVEALLPQGGSTGRRVIHFVGLVSLCLLAVVLLRNLSREDEGGGWTIRPLTTYPGVEYMPALSPDGSLLAFSWRGEEGAGGSDYDIYVMQVDGGTPVRLTSEAGHELFPCWSPDGGTVAFATGAGDSFRICTIPMLGGAPRRLLALASQPAGLDWSPDGSTLAFAARADSSTAYGINLLALDTLEPRQLAVERPDGSDDVMPAFSPGGGTLAFVRMRDFNIHEVLLAPVGGGDARKLSGVKHRVSGVDWLSDHELVISTATMVDYDLWLADLETGERTWLTTPAKPAISPTVAGGGGRMIYGEVAYDCHIWHIDLPRAGAIEPAREPLIASTRMDYNPVCSPGGESIAFISDRSGSSELWIAAADGSGQRRITEGIGPYLRNPCWSPDGRRIAFSTLAEDHLAIFVADVETELVTRNSTASRHELLMHWSASGEWLYYRAQQGEGWELRRRHVADGRDEHLADGGYTVIDALAGGALLCRRDGDPGLWRVPASGGDGELLLSGEIVGDWISVAAVETGLYFFRSNGSSTTCGFHDWATARSESLGVVPPISGFLRISPDRSRLLYDCTKKLEIDLMLAEAAD